MPSSPPPATSSAHSSIGGTFARPLTLAPTLVAHPYHSPLTAHRSPLTAHPHPHPHRSLTHTLILLPSPSQPHPHPLVLDDVRWSVADNCISVISRFGLYNQVIVACACAYCVSGRGGGVLVKYGMGPFGAVTGCIKANDNEWEY